MAEAIEHPISPVDPARLPAAIEDRVVATFAAFCATCAWQGTERGNSLRALTDYDRHITTSTHALAVIAATAAEDDGDDAA